MTRAEVHSLAERYTGARGIGHAWEAIGLMDGGAASPRETRLRLMLTDAGLPRPQTSIDIGDDWIGAVIATGWPELKVGVGFVDKGTGVHAAAGRIRHHNGVALNGWIEVLVDDNFLLRPTLHRVREAMRLQRVARHRT